MDSSINILALDTSSNYCSVALQYNGIIEQISSLPLERSSRLLAMIDKLLNNMPINKLNILAFAAGPGSLTGLKIASCIMQALHSVYKKPIMKISTLQALALLAYEKFGSKLIIPCMDAKMGQIYYGIYKFDDNSTDQIPQELQKDKISSPKEVLQLNYDALLIGDGVAVVEKNISPDIQTKLKIIPSTIYTNAESIIKIATYAYKKYGIISNDANPIYLCSYD